MTEETTFQHDRELIRARLNKYTRKAFRMLPKIDRPRILDVGCGSGIPTIELAKLSKGEITGIDIHQPSLDRLAERIEETGLSDHIKTRHCSMFDMDFPDESFDIIWAEGSISAIGFKRGLREWKRFLKPKGFMVIHDEQGDVNQKLEQISACGYELLGYFKLSTDTWQSEYLTSLEELIRETRTKHADDPKIAEELKDAQWEVDEFRKHPERNSSVYFVMRRVVQS
jgi:ubiquinone/menaquinone biosynthesis C-methylase UbiE